MLLNGLAGPVEVLKTRVICLKVLNRQGIVSLGAGAPQPSERARAATCSRESLSELLRFTRNYRHPPRVSAAIRRRVTSCGDTFAIFSRFTGSRVSLAVEAFKFPSSGN
jgi:hypothetical protein